ncbi:hypothetical protein ABRT01_16155 [Lentibacillus sp. L22]|uniref:hypothetical protein n=1 Tax=Lentibacillus sp. L22 TaxID=3163028 RepID=UPI003466A050
MAGDPYMMGHITVAGANFMFDDIVTIADSNATAADKMMAGLFLFGKPVKLVDKGYDLYRSAYKTRKVDKGNAVSEFAGKINATNIPNMSKKDILDNLPNKWKHTDHNGFIHIRDSKGNIRMKIDPPDKVTKYDHVHIFDENGNPLDINLNIVDRKSPDAHIPYENEDD